MAWEGNIVGEADQQVIFLPTGGGNIEGVDWKAVAI